EAMEVHWVIERGEVDDAPEDRIALGILVPLGMRPGEPVDRHRAAGQAGPARGVDRTPPRKREDIVRRVPGCVRRLHNDHAVELTVLVESSTERGRAGLGNI